MSDTNERSGASAGSVAGDPAAWGVEMALLHATDCEEEVATMRGLLERTK